MYNGGFEQSTIAGIADGWRPHKSSEMISDESYAFEGINAMRLSDGGWLNYPALVEKGMTIKLSGHVRSETKVQNGYLKILFKDQAQNTLQSKQISFETNSVWTEKELIAKVPDNVWSAWIVLQAGEDSNIDFDAVELTVIKQP